MATLPEEAILHSVAIGHTPNPENLKEPVLAPLWQLPTAYAPAGALLCSSATDVLRFAEMHLNDGKTQDGNQLLSSESVRAMRESQIDVPWPNPLYVNGWGLGFFLFEWSGARGFGHNGDTIGQHCEFRVFPDNGIAFVLLVNNTLGAYDFADEVTNEVLNELAGITVPILPAEPVKVDQDLSTLAGTYETPSVVIVTKVQGDQLLVDITPRGAAAVLSSIPPLQDSPLMPIGEGAFALDVLGVVKVPLVFYDFDEDGRPRYLDVGLRAVPRTS
jgi:hypothetical protein